MEQKLSDLKLGDTFIFISGQDAMYEIFNKSFQILSTNNHIKYIVKKVNPTSVKVETIESNIEYTFKFKGFFSNYIPGKDCLIKILYEN